MGTHAMIASTHENFVGNTRHAISQPHENGLRDGADVCHHLLELREGERLRPVLDGAFRVRVRLDNQAVRAFQSAIRAIEIGQLVAVFLFDVRDRESDSRQL